ncbi:MAG: ATP-binding protein, partial [Caldisphaera sp.]|nr:ATP-binding protein [Caldisphaera sp.]
LAYRSSPFCNVLILDWTGEYEESLKDSNIISVLSNPFDPFKIKEVNGREDILIDSLSSSLGLTQPQQYMLMKIIEDNRPSSLSDLIKKIENYEEESRWDRDVKRGLLRKIEMLNNSVKENKNSFSIDMIKNGINIVRLSEINSINARKAFALFLLAIIYLEKSRNGRNLLIVIDEAQNLLESEGGSLIEQMMAESRKYGINIVLSTQSPSMVPNNILLNANTKIIHALKSARDKEIIASSMNLSRDLLNQLDKLDKGEAIIQSVSLPNPIIVRVEPINEIRNKSEKVFKGKPIDIDPKV